MRVLITGGTGLIGARLCQPLLKENHEIIILSRDPQAHAAQFPTAVQLHPWDGHTASGWADLINADTALVNLAGAYPISWLWDPAQQQYVLDSRIDAAQAIAKAIQQATAPPRLLLQASTADYYGDCGDEMLIEQSPPGAGWRASLVAEWEQATAAVPVRQCWLRFGFVVDRSRRTLLTKMLAANPQWVPWVHYHDAARAIQFLLTCEHASGPVNVVAPRPARVACFRRVLAEMKGKAPKPAASDVYLESQRVLPDRLTDWGFRFSLTDAEDALRSTFY